MCKVDFLPTLANTSAHPLQPPNTPICRTQGNPVRQSTGNHLPCFAYCTLLLLLHVFLIRHLTSRSNPDKPNHCCLVSRYELLLSIWTVGLSYPLNWMVPTIWNKVRLKSKEIWVSGNLEMSPIIPLPFGHILGHTDTRGIQPFNWYEIGQVNQFEHDPSHIPAPADPYFCGNRAILRFTISLDNIITTECKYTLEFQSERWPFKIQLKITIQIHFTFNFSFNQNNIDFELASAWTKVRAIVLRSRVHPLPSDFLVMNHHWWWIKILKIMI